MKSIDIYGDEIIEIGRRMYARGFVAANDGNISIRLNASYVLITASGVSKGFLGKEDLILLDLEGNKIEGKKEPSSESGMHLHIYRKRKDVFCVCHAHPPYASAFAVAGIDIIDPILPEAIIALGDVPVVAYGTPGTDEFFPALDKIISDHEGFLLANHGAVTMGTKPMEAWQRMEVLEHTAHILFLARQFGKYNILDDQEVKKLKQLRQKFYPIKDQE